MQTMASGTVPTPHFDSSLSGTSAQEEVISSIRERCLNSSQFFSTISQLIRTIALRYLAGTQQKKEYKLGDICK